MLTACGEEVDENGEEVNTLVLASSEYTNDFTEAVKNTGSQKVTLTTVYTAAQTAQFEINVLEKPSKPTYTFHDSVTILDAGTDGSYGTSGTYAYFGDWPCSAKEAEVDVDESQYITMGGFTYYYGNDNSYYLKNSGKYFKVEPIKWRVLETDETDETKKFLFAEDILSACCFTDKSTDTPDYEYSTIRAYLNGGTSVNDEYKDQGFLYSAFTENGISKINDTVVTNGSTDKHAYTKTSSTSTTGTTCNDTTDKIFLLSRWQLTKLIYDDPQKTLVRKTSDYSDSIYDWNRYGYYYWTRSPADTSSETASDASIRVYVLNNYSAQNNAYTWQSPISTYAFYNSYYNTYYPQGVVPALWATCSE